MQGWPYHCDKRVTILAQNVLLAASNNGFSVERDMQAVWLHFLNSLVLRSRHLQHSKKRASADGLSVGSPSYRLQLHACSEKAITFEDFPSIVAQDKIAKQTACLKIFGRLEN